MYINIQKPILDQNDRLAADIKEQARVHHIYLLDLLASPGAGKTSLILATIAALRHRYRIAVIEGDIASQVDAQKIKDAGIPAVQINTGGICHLEARMILRALDVLDLPNLDMIIIENVGNLVCPTDFYLGEDAKAMILSVPEGHDKPLKYPGVFQVARAVVLNKIDTLNAFDFDERQFAEDIHQLNPQAPVFPLSATTARGLDAWTQWLDAQIQCKTSASALVDSQTRAPASSTTPDTSPAPAPAPPLVPPSSSGSLAPASSSPPASSLAFVPTPPFYKEPSCSL
ncbi:MAG: hydrogenase nickel incorporation protein HypB [Coriobacteriales bacterium]|jgi:hydrogenase nickel incorporation protein HypB|nr:hydrogenase nickel incorporation protein HypB [Coriobacteriales bacterium]